MSSLSLFKSKEPTAIPRPALASLKNCLQLSAGISNQIESLNVKLTQAHRDIAFAANLEASITATRDAVDKQMADAHYSDAKPPDLTEAKRKLAELEELHTKRAAGVARFATLLLPQLQSDIAALCQQKANLKPQTDEFLWRAAVEEAIVLRAEYQSASDQLRNIAHRVFTAFTAADAIARSRAYGVFHGSHLYAELHIPTPQHPAFQNATLTPEAAQAIRFADVSAVNDDAEALINRLLNGEIAA